MKELTFQELEELVFQTEQELEKESGELTDSLKLFADPPRFAEL
ncbi:hypothetical protein ACFSCZ_17975 [Siminovitchia sediminis]|uniref:Uncharacterized protein n=1 Tax=Siminovitchia sediminis TaxID=1274353 RepID=A0ABW4KMX9_9BACI